eukprot:s39_g22.t1
MIPADFARGRLIIIHRDGEFPKAELASLRAYHEELVASKGGSKTTFVLVECVKWAGGSPRLYDGTKSAPAGTMLALSVLGDVAHTQFAMARFAWVQSVFDLSYLHHGSVLKRPRLPITTHFADRLAYMLSALGKDGGEWESELTADKEAEMVMASLRQIFREADEDGSGDLDHGELRTALGKFRVRDRLKLLQIPYPDLEMLFLLLDEDLR